MKEFAALLDRLVLTPQRNGKITLLVDYFRQTPDPDRGLALAAITRDLDIANVKPAMLRGLIAERMDEQLFAYSYDYVGDLAETISLAWTAREPSRANAIPTLGDVVASLARASRSDAIRLVEKWLDQLDASARYALLKLVTGGLRIGVSARLAKQALADFGKVDVGEIEELWHGLKPPYQSLFAWLEGKAEKPASLAAAPFRPVMLSTPLEETDYAKIIAEDYAAEWKWDGIRVQLTAEAGQRRIYSRTGDDISHAFPDIADAMNFEGTLDGELLVARSSTDTIEIGAFGDLQQRLNRKIVTAKQMESHPAFVRLYDLLFDRADDIRALPFTERREKLERFVATLDATRFDLSPLVPYETFHDLVELRKSPPHPIIEGLMLKRRDSTYVPGRPKGPWFKWKRDPFTIDAVLVYAQRGHGKRSSFYSDYTFAVWTGPDENPHLVPVGKAYFGFTDEELKQLDAYVRNNTTERFGPVRSVRAEPDHGLVLEIAFEGLNRSKRHKSGVAMRFPRISRLRWDKPPIEADRLETLEALLRNADPVD
ncbi:cisplatin damage response ATP-dependent DNA ligase [Phyllobacterium meliloti]|uniref:cisplatin damage response ATP-dependent DNA ligase n=1 Tax=Phyllobacterium meliloti TaxID=555317 RepID=UPI001D141D73|nr:cisplatin damage response ATP-dependent DNA ligase [Phyllobacterium sp. T1293]UGX88838.1 cisplatin damage response ATP-dependent DNA ligase [Phyllobacterium sp. T1293]